MFTRELTPTLKKVADSFPAIFLTGPRQSGKTTLLRQTFPDYTYISLERPDVLERMKSDPLGFLQDHEQKWIIDEAQRFPEIFSYIQDRIDQMPKRGQFILSGSQNFLLSQHISQTLAGRASILELLPLTYHEYRTHEGFTEMDVWPFLFYGGYPRPYQEALDHHLWLGSYVRTYIERDVRDLLNIKDLSKFSTFLKLCAGRHGQLLNLNALAVDAGISQTTATEWLSLLEASYILFRLKPYYKNFNKRLVKTPKLFFYDSGLLCYLLGIESPEHLAMHAQRGAVFEGFAITELMKQQLAQGDFSDFYFWRDHLGLEIDLLKEHGNEQIAFEIKSSKTFQTDFLHSLLKWTSITGNKRENSHLIYAGDQNFRIQNMHVWKWSSLDRCAKEVL
jgi:predicted AAA+ superfamily ATPase